MGGNGIQLVRHIRAVERRAVHVFIVIHQKFSGLDAAGGKAHDGNIVRVNSVHIRVFADEPDSSRHIQRPFLLCIGGKAVIYDKCLEPHFPQRKEMLARKQEALHQTVRELQDSIAYIDWKQNYYDEVLSDKRPYESNLICAED